MTELKFNMRSATMFDHISRHVDFWGKSVIDLGCGYGDILLYAAGEGATHITGVDVDSEMISMCVQKFAKQVIHNPQYSFVRANLNWIDEIYLNDYFDVAICTSVIPYLDTDSIDRVINWMVDHSDVSIVEAQYVGDGPGIFEDGARLKRFLEQYFSNVEHIGYTKVENRNAQRDIWLCKNA